MVKLNLGCGDTKIEGFIGVDLYDEKADVRADICELPFENESVEEIVAYQVIEHLPYWKTSIMENSTPAFFEECYRVMKPGATMVTECPDLEWIAKKIVETGDIDYNITVNLYGEYYRPWDSQRYKDWESVAAGKHITGFTWKKIQGIAEHFGFKVERNPMDKKHPNYKYEENLSVRWTK